MTAIIVIIVLLCCTFFCGYGFGWTNGWTARSRHATTDQIIKCEKCGWWFQPPRRRCEHKDCPHG